MRFRVTRPCTAGPNGESCVFGLFVGVSVTRSSLRVWNGRTDTLSLEQAFLRRGIIQPEHGRHLLDTETTPRRHQ